MSHSQFHCTGRAYLDMHGLIFETSICYWQDQPGRGKRARRRGAGRAGGGWGGERQTPARRGSRERRGGPGRALAGPGDPTAPVPPAARTPDRATHPRGPRGSRRVAATAREARGGGGVVRRGGGRRAALLSPSSIPPGPGHTGDGRRAPSASVRLSVPFQGLNSLKIQPLSYLWCCQACTHSKQSGQCPGRIDARSEACSALSLKPNKTV